MRWLDVEKAIVCVSSSSSLLVLRFSLIFPHPLFREEPQVLITGSNFAQKAFVMEGDGVPFSHSLKLRFPFAGNQSRGEGDDAACFKHTT